MNESRLDQQAGPLADQEKREGVSRNLEWLRGWYGWDRQEKRSQEVVSETPAGEKKGQVEHDELA